MAVSGLGVAVVTGGMLLAYAGFQGTNPLSALRDIASGSPVAIPNISGSRTKASVGEGDSTIVGKVPDPGYPPLVAALEPFKGDKYSQAHRWDPGFSDCSSFPGKAFKALGIKPPGSSTTWDYLGWDMLVKIGSIRARPGDLVISTTHMAVIVGPNQATGQQNPTRNVRTGTVADIMTGSGSYGYYRYTPARATAAA